MTEFTEFTDDDLDKMNKEELLQFIKQSRERRKVEGILVEVKKG